MLEIRCIYEGYPDDDIRQRIEDHWSALVREAREKINAIRDSAVPRYEGTAERIIERYPAHIQYQIDLIEQEAIASMADYASRFGILCEQVKKGGANP